MVDSWCGYVRNIFRYIMFKGIWLSKVRNRMAQHIYITWDFILEEPIETEQSLTYVLFAHDRTIVGRMSRV